MPRARTKPRDGIYRMNQSHSTIADHIQSYRDGGIASRELGYYVALRPVLSGTADLYWGTCPSKRGLATPLGGTYGKLLYGTYIIALVGY